MPSDLASSIDDCAHCGRPVPPARRGRHEELFCCAGCETVHGWIRETGLGDYYEHRDADASVPLPQPSDSSFEELDDATFTERAVQRKPDGMWEALLALEGLHCSACVWLLERLPSRVAGLLELRVDLARSRVWVRWDPTQILLSRIASNIDRLGYRPHPYSLASQEARAQKEDRQLLVRLAVCGAIAGNCMLIAFALYSGQFSGMDHEHSQLFRWVSFAIAIPAVWVGGSVFFRGAWNALRAGTLSIDLPISLGILTATLGGGWNTIRAQGDVYFDSITALIFLLLVGRFIQRKQLRRAADARELLRSLYPRRAHRLDRHPPESASVPNPSDPDREAAASERRVVDVPVDALEIGDTIEVRPAEVLPADGVILSGRSQLDRSLMTGESKPIEITTGEPVQAGVTNLSGVLTVQVTALGAETRLGQLLDRVEESTRARPAMVEMADRLAGKFVTAVVALALITLAYWLRRDPTHAFDAVLAVLVVTCPCALGLATPLAFAAALGRAARAGILVRSAISLEQLSRPGRIWFDKTGTLTSGDLELTQWWGDTQTKRYAAALERQTSHLIGAAFNPYDDPTIEVEDFQETAGAGVTGLIDGERWSIGSPRFASNLSSADPDPNWTHALQSTAEQGATPVVVLRNNIVVAVGALSDPIRSGAARILDRLRSTGWDLTLVSGDDRAVVERVGEVLGFAPSARFAQASPEEKETRITEASANDPGVSGASRAPAPVQVMVGDGVNDAAALAAADVGIGVRGGAEAALSACDIYLQEGGIDDLPCLLSGAHRTLRVVRRNLTFSLAYNAIGASLAIFGIIGPLGAALLMPLSSLTVTVNSIASRTFDPRRNPADLDSPASLRKGVGQTSLPTNSDATASAAPDSATVVQEAS